MVEYLKVFRHIGFLFEWRLQNVAIREAELMSEPDLTVAQQIAQAAMAFERQRTGHVPKSITVVLSGSTLVITLHDALTPTEMLLAKSPTGADKIAEFHRLLFGTSADIFRQAIKTITGLDVHEVATDIAPASCAVVIAFTTGTVVQVFLLRGNTRTETWTENVSDDAAEPSSNKATPDCS